MRVVSPYQSHALPPSPPSAPLSLQACCCPYAVLVSSAVLAAAAVAVEAEVAVDYSKAPRFEYSCTHTLALSGAAAAVRVASEGAIAPTADAVACN